MASAVCDNSANPAATATARLNVRVPFIFDTLDVADLIVTVDVSPQPYEYEAAARIGLEEMYREMMRRTDQCVAMDEAAMESARSQLAAVCYQLGRIHYDRSMVAAKAAAAAAVMDDRMEVAERAQAMNMFLQAHRTVEHREALSDNVLTSISTLNMLGLIEGKHNGNTEDALHYLSEAEYVYQTHCEMASKRGSGRERYEGPQRSPPPPPTSCTPVRELLSAWRGPRLNPTPASAATAVGDKHPLVFARLYTLFYVIDLYKSMGRFSDALIRTHFALKLQAQSDLFLQSPLDWAMCCALISQLLVEQQAYAQARHHLAAASTMMDDVIPREYAELNDTEKFRQFSANIAYYWSRYGINLLEKSKTRMVKRKTDNKSSVFFDSMDFANFTIVDEKRVPAFYVNTYEEAQALADYTVLCLNDVRKYYTLEKFPSYHALLCLDIHRTYQILSYFQMDPDKMCKLFQKGIVEMELVVNKMNTKDESSMNVCRRIWYQLGTTYGDMMDMKYERHVRNQPVVTECAKKKINHCVESAVKYFTKYIESFYVDKQMPVQILPNTYVKQVLNAHLHIARCINKKIVAQKDEKLEIILQCKQYYEVVLDYCKKNPNAARIVSTELDNCRTLFKGIPAKIERLKKTNEPLHHFI